MSAAWSDGPPFAWLPETVDEDGDLDRCANGCVCEDEDEPGLLLRGVFYAALIQGAGVVALSGLVAVVLLVAHLL